MYLVFFYSVISLKGLYRELESKVGLLLLLAAEVTLNLRT